MLLIHVIAPVVVIGHWFPILATMILRAVTGLMCTVLLGWLGREIYEGYQKGNVLLPQFQRQDVGSDGADSLILLGQEEGTLKLDEAAMRTKVDEHVMGREVHWLFPQ
jgi:hypothetical protein